MPFVRPHRPVIPWQDDRNRGGLDTVLNQTAHQQIDYLRATVARVASETTNQPCRRVQPGRLVLINGASQSTISTFGKGCEASSAAARLQNARRRSCSQPRNVRSRVYGWHMKGAPASCGRSARIPARSVINYLVPIENTPCPHDKMNCFIFKIAVSI